MAKRLRMTTADYVAIAVSPALIMALVGSLVFFLIEVLYVGDYTARLVYVFALFVFATVLIARLAIEFGAEHAALYGAPLGALTFLALIRFVEFPHAYSHLINLALMAVVWWWAHKLTVNCTLIDDDEDASGEGLMQQVGLDTGEAASPGLSSPKSAASEPRQPENELLTDSTKPTAVTLPWWRRWFGRQKQTHPPGIWVLFFSLVALLLFGVGQHWIPPAETGRRRYVFALLAVYVASALALLVTTSFLGLRRYLRQRRLEMPAPMAATWVGVGAVLILIVMLLAALIPRPGAEYAMSQVPWQAGSPSDFKSSRVSVGREGTEDDQAANKVTSDKGPQGDETQEGAKGDPAQSDQGKSTASSEGQKSDQSASQSSSNDSSKGEGNKSDTGASTNKDAKPADGSKTADGQNQQSSNTASRDNASQSEQRPSNKPSNIAPPQHSPMESVSQVPQALATAASSLAGALKLALYFLLAVVIGVLAWRHRQEIARAMADILKQLRNLLARLFGGGSAATSGGADSPTTTAQKRERSFAEYHDPFATGDNRRLPPEELVRYTFEAFEAWARDGGCPRSADQTPAELVRAAVPPKTELYDEARRMVRLYSEMAYASGSVPRASADSLRELWRLMRAMPRAVPDAVAS